MKKSKIYEAPACKVHEIQVEGVLCVSLMIWNPNSVMIEDANSAYYDKKGYQW